jgi:hypothetical protein
MCVDWVGTKLIRHSKLDLETSKLSDALASLDAAGWTAAKALVCWIPNPVWNDGCGFAIRPFAWGRAA